MAAATLLCLALGLLAASSAAAAPTWLPPDYISDAEAEPTYVPRVAVDADGNATAVWKEQSFFSVIQAATRPAGGEWQEPVDLAEAGNPGAGEAELAVNAHGDAVAVWDRQKYIQAAFKPAGEAWEPAVKISADGDTANQADVAIDPNGRLVAVWTWREKNEAGVPYLVQAAIRPVGGSWDGPVDLSDDTEDAQNPQVAVDPAGNAIAVWREYSGGGDSVVNGSIRGAGDVVWAPAEELSAGTVSYDPELAIDSKGHAVAIWRTDTGTPNVIESADRPPGGPWTAPQPISALDEVAQFARVAADSNGDAVAVWQNSTTNVIEASEKPAGGGWQDPMEISADEVGGAQPELAVGAQGDAVAVWKGDSVQSLEAAVRPADAAWQPALEVSEESSEAGHPDVAVDAQGNAVAVRDRSDEGVQRIEAAGYDAAGPQLRSLAVPTGGGIGQLLAFSVSPFDVWSPLGPTSWSFGDGHAAIGTSAGHSYAVPGSHLVTLTGADALGNTTTAMRAIGIAPNPPLPGTVVFNGFAEVRGGRALLRARCLRGPCDARVRMIARKKVRGGGRGARGSAKARFRQFKIGNSPRFTLAAGTRKTVSVPLARSGRRELRKRRGNRLRVRLVGRGAKPRSILLKEVRPRRRNRR